MKIKPANEPGSVVVALGPRERQLPESTAHARLFNPKKILVPIDFSDCSRKALQYAIPFARQCNATLTLLHVVQPYFPVPEISTVDWDLIQARLCSGAQAEIAKVRDSVNAGVKVDALVRSGKPAIEILNVAKESQIDLIILSTHGHTGMARAFLGSTAERVVQRAACPVLVVRGREDDFIDRPGTIERDEEMKNPKCEAMTL